MITLREIFTTYWSQATLILVGIGYFIKRLLDNASKKSEINHTLFQQKRLESVNNFFTTCARTEQMWISIALWDILENKVLAKDIDEMIYPHLNELKRNVLELQIYFQEKDHKPFAGILENAYAINRKLSNVFFDIRADRTLIQRSNEFQSYRDQKFLENEKIFDRITENLRRAFKS